MKKGRRPLTVRHFLIMLAEINARYDALILDARLRRSPEAEHWEREKEKFGRKAKLKY